MKADIFSLGVVLWEIITLERPAWRGNLRDIRCAPGRPQTPMEQRACLPEAHAPACVVQGAARALPLREHARIPKWPCAGRGTAACG